MQINYFPKLLFIRHTTNIGFVD